MTTTPQQLLREALELPVDQRARLVTELLSSIEPAIPSQQRTDAEWMREVQRRARAAITGTPGLSWDEALRLVHERLSQQ